MASQGAAAGTSRLAQMQMRFQQKQQEEREQRRIEMTAAAKSTIDDDTSSTLNSSFGRGKVRQMFDERRRGTGIDKSYPLKPITTTGRSTSGGNTNTNKTTPQRTKTSLTTTTTNNNATKTGIKKQSSYNTSRYNNSSTTTTTDTHRIDRNFNINNNNNNEDIVYGNGNNNINILNGGKPTTILSNKQYVNDPFNDEDDNQPNENYIDDETFPNSIEIPKTTYPNKLRNVGKLNSNSLDEKLPINGGNIVNNFNINDELQNTNNLVQLNPVVTRKSLPLNSQTTNQNIQKPLKNTSQSPTNNNNKMASALTVNRQQRYDLDVVSDMVQCKMCGRNFNKDRVDKHQQICIKSAKPRKVFDAAKHRIKGTDVEMFTRHVNKPSTRSTSNIGGSNGVTTPSRTSSTATSKTKAAVSSIRKSSTTTSKNTVETATTTGKKESNWRKTHEEFIATIREAKKVQKYLARGGKLSDLPPPPPSENPDYVQCPHCNRRFNETAASRHIPKCATMLHNKPKPLPAKKRV